MEEFGYKVKRGTSEDWSSYLSKYRTQYGESYIPADGKLLAVGFTNPSTQELYYKLKIGNGSTRFEDLPFIDEVYNQGITIEEILDDISKKQDKLIPGQNISIDGNVISATGGGSGGSYTAGKGIKINNGVISISDDNFTIYMSNNSHLATDNQVALIKDAFPNCKVGDLILYFNGTADHVRRLYMIESVNNSVSPVTITCRVISKYDISYFDGNGNPPTSVSTSSSTPYSGIKIGDVYFDKTNKRYSFCTNRSGTNPITLSWKNFGNDYTAGRGIKINDNGVISFSDGINKVFRSNNIHLAADNQVVLEKAAFDNPQLYDLIAYVPDDTTNHIRRLYIIDEMLENSFRCRVISKYDMNLFTGAGNPPTSASDSVYSTGYVDEKDLYYDTTNKVYKFCASRNGNTLVWKDFGTSGGGGSYNAGNGIKISGGIISLSDGTHKVFRSDLSNFATDNEVRTLYTAFNDVKVNDLLVYTPSDVTSNHTRRIYVADDLQRNGQTDLSNPETIVWRVISKYDMQIFESHQGPHNEKSYYPGIKQGDLCYDTIYDKYYICQDVSGNNVVWLPIINFYAGNGINVSYNQPSSGNTYDIVSVKNDGYSLGFDSNGRLKVQIDDTLGATFLQIEDGLWFNWQDFCFYDGVRAALCSDSGDGTPLVNRQDISNMFKVWTGTNSVSPISYNPTTEYIGIKQNDLYYCTTNECLYVVSGVVDSGSGSYFNIKPSNNTIVSNTNPPSSYSGNTYNIGNLWVNKTTGKIWMCTFIFNESYPPNSIYIWTELIQENQNSDDIEYQNNTGSSSIDCSQYSKLIVHSLDIESASAVSFGIEPYIGQEAQELIIIDSGSVPNASSFPSNEIDISRYTSFKFKTGAVQGQGSSTVLYTMKDGVVREYELSNYYNKNEVDTLVNDVPKVWGITNVPSDNTINISPNYIGVKYKDFLLEGTYGPKILYVVDSVGTTTFKVTRVDQVFNKSTNPPTTWSSPYYQVGSIWINYTTAQVWILKDVQYEIYRWELLTSGKNTDNIEITEGTNEDLDVSNINSIYIKSFTYTNPSNPILPSVEVSFDDSTFSTVIVLYEGDTINLSSVDTLYWRYSNYSSAGSSVDVVYDIIEEPNYILHKDDSYRKEEIDKSVGTRISTMSTSLKQSMSDSDDLFFSKSKNCAENIPKYSWGSEITGDDEEEYNVHSYDKLWITEIRRDNPAISGSIELYNENWDLIRTISLDMNSFDNFYDISDAYYLVTMADIMQVKFKIGIIFDKWKLVDTLTVGTGDEAQNYDWEFDEELYDDVYIRGDGVSVTANFAARLYFSISSTDDKNMQSSTVTGPLTSEVFNLQLIREIDNIYNCYRGSGTAKSSTILNGDNTITSNKKITKVRLFTTIGNQFTEGTYKLYAKVRSDI